MVLSLGGWNNPLEGGAGTGDMWGTITYSVEGGAIAKETSVARTGATIEGQTFMEQVLLPVSALWPECWSAVCPWGWLPSRLEPWFATVPSTLLPAAPTAQQASLPRAEVMPQGSASAAAGTHAHAWASQGCAQSVSSIATSTKTIILAFPLNIVV